MIFSKISSENPPLTITKKKLCGLFIRKERWGFSWYGRLIVWAIFFLGLLFCFLNIRSFLAQTERAKAEILVVEGWVSDYAIEAAEKEFHAGHYKKIYTTGGPITKFDGRSDQFTSSAEVGAYMLIKKGVPASAIQIVPSDIYKKDRTYNSALALRNWFTQNKITEQNINVLTQDVHARRTGMLFQNAFGNTVHVGIISVANPDYNPDQWWNYSEGVREVIGETIAYLYALFFFHA